MGAKSLGINRIGFAPRHPALTIAQANAHWAGKHGEVAGGLHGMTRYWQNHAILADDGMPLLPWVGFDCCSDFEFTSLFDMDRAFTSDHYLQYVKPDEEILVDKTRGGGVTADHFHLSGQIEMKHVRLLQFMRVAPLRSGGELGEALKALPAGRNASARELYVAHHGKAAGQRVSVFDAIDIHWFETPQAALEFTRSLEQAERRRAVADLVRGTESLLARVNVIK